MNTAAIDQDLSQLRVAVLGAGKMGGILLQAFLKQQILHPDQLLATVAHADRAAALSAQWGVQVSTDNRAAVEQAAGIEIPVIRAMPNTPSMLGAGISALCRGRYVTEPQMALATRIFETIGRTVVVDEKHMDAVTGLSASGPAFIYIILESLAEAGVKV